MLNLYQNSRLAKFCYDKLKIENDAFDYMLETYLELQKKEENVATFKDTLITVKQYKEIWKTKDKHVTNIAAKQAQLLKYFKELES